MAKYKIFRMLRWSMARRCWELTPCPAKLLSVSGGIRQYGLAVPKTATLPLYMDKSLLVADQSGVGMPPRTLAAAVRYRFLIR
jgi:hypothetical protein